MNIFGRRSRPAQTGAAAPAEATPVGGTLVAVIAAAVAASSGMAPGSFRVVGIEPGFNTPVWGRVERLNRGE